MRKQVTALTAGDVIDPPAGEKVWLWRDGVKRRYTVQAVKPGGVTKKGEFVRIVAVCDSPYRDQPFPITCEMLATKSVTVFNA